MSYSETQEARDAFVLFERRIEAAFSDDVALGAIRAEINGADMADFDRERLLGWIAQYQVDRRAMHADQREAADDGRAGGPTE